MVYSWLSILHTGKCWEWELATWGIPAVQQHVLESDWQSRVVAVDHHADGVTHQTDIYPCLPGHTAQYKIGGRKFLSRLYLQRT